MSRPASDDEDGLHNRLYGATRRSADAVVSGSAGFPYLKTMAQAVAQRLALPAQRLGEAVARRSARGCWASSPLTRARVPGRRLRRHRAQPGGIAVWWILALGCLVGAITPALPSRRALVAAALLAALGVWSWIGVATSESAERTLSEVARIATYLGVLLLGLFTLDRRRAPRRCSAWPARSSSSPGSRCCRGCSRSLFPANETGAFLADRAAPAELAAELLERPRRVVRARRPARARPRRRPSQRRGPGARRRRAAGPRAVHRPDDLARRHRRRRARRRGAAVRRAERGRASWLHSASPASRARSWSAPPHSGTSSTRTSRGSAALQQGDELHGCCWSSSGRGAGADGPRAARAHPPARASLDALRGRSWPAFKCRRRGRDPARVVRR